MSTVAIGPRWRHIRWVARAAGIMLAYLVMLPTLCVHARGFVGPVEAYRSWPTAEETTAAVRRAQRRAAIRRRKRRRQLERHADIRQYLDALTITSPSVTVFRDAEHIERQRLGLEWQTNDWHTSGIRLDGCKVDVSSDGAWVRMYDPKRNRYSHMSMARFQRRMRGAPYAG